jgi:3-oxoacyl-[acyl-carrier-protein] synthase-3
MDNYTLQGIQLKGIAACVPRETEYTGSYSMFSAQEAAAFEKRVGVISRRNSKGKYTTSDLCLRAAQQLMADVSWAPESIGLLLFISQTPDYALPASSAILQSKLGLPGNCMSLDIRLGCTGWVSGLSYAGGLMKAFGIQRALVLVGETAILSDYADASTYPLMGDAGTATCVELDGAAAPMVFNSFTDGSRYDAIIAPGSGARHIADTKDNNAALSIKTTMKGADIFEFTIAQVLPSVQELLVTESGGVSSIDYFVFHQANKMITESLRKKLDVPVEKCPYSIGQFGNTSSASVPLTIVTQIKSIKGRCKILCSSFGVGLSVANVLLETNDLYCSELIEIE